MKTQSIFDKTIANPEVEVGSPAELVEDNRFTVVQKHEILESWKCDAEAMLEATNENMSGSAESPDAATLLRQINEALQALQQASKRHKTTD